MKAKRLGVRIAAVASPAMLAACDQDRVDEAIGDFIEGLIIGFFKIIAISLGLLLAWAAAAAIGGALIALGVRRKRLDALALLSILAGTACVVGAWPLVFSQNGLAGVWAPGSTGEVTAGPIVGQASAVLGVVVVAITLVRRHRRKRPPAVAAATTAPPPPPPPVEPPAPPTHPEPPTVAVEDPAPAKVTRPRTARSKNGKRPSASKKPVKAASRR